MRNSLLAALLCLPFISPAAAPRGDFWPNHIVRHMGVRDGLPGNFVDDICQDSRGFMWFAINGYGVARYDGQEFRLFSCDAHPQLGSDFAHALAADEAGGVWIGTDHGLAHFDAARARLDEAPLTGPQGDTLPDAPIYHMTTGGGDMAWVARRNSLIVMARDSEGRPRVADMTDLPADITALATGFRGIYAASGPDIYLCHYDTRRQRMATKREHRAGIAAAGGAAIEALAESSGFLWVGTSVGLCRYNQATGEETVYRHSDSDPHSLAQDRVTDIEIDTQGRVIVATLKGLNIYRHETNDFERIAQDDAQPGKSLASNFVNCLHSTSQGLWVGTDVAGADFICPTPLDIENHTSGEICGDTWQHKSQRNTFRPVNTIVEDPDGTLWVGIVEGGLARRARGAKSFDIFNSGNSMLCHNSVSSLGVDGQGRLWVGTWGGGVDIVVPRRGGIEIEKHVGTQDGTLGSDFVGAMAPDTINGGMWVATIRDICFVRGDSVFHPIEASSLSGMNGALGACTDNRGRLWMATSLGIFEIDLRTFDEKSHTVSHKLICHRLDNPAVAGDPRVTFLLFSPSRGRLLASTNGMGVFAADTGRDSLAFVRTADGASLANNCAASLAEDRDGNLWVGTANGLSRIDGKSGTVSNFYTNDGLLSDCYYWNAAYGSPTTGRVYLGTLEGLVELNPQAQMRQQAATSAPTLTSLEVGGKAVGAEENVENLGALRIHESDKSFAVGFASLSYAPQQTVRYQYRLDGFDNGWVATAAGQHAARYTNLSPGSYTLRIRHAVGAGNWSEERRLGVTVVPYFWRTTWFITLAAGLCAAAVVAAFRLRMRSLETQRRTLRQQVRERTMELETQKSILEEKRAELEKTNAELTRQKESILEMTSKIQRLSVDKLQFFTSVSHELRSPLTLIMGPVRRAKKLTKMPEVTAQLDLVERNAESLLETVNQLMDFRKVETDNFEPHPISTNLRDYVEGMVAPYAAYAAERGIRLRTFFHILSPFVRIDTDALTKILSNLLSNAIKYSGDGKIVDLFVCQLRQGGRLQTYLCVRDRGIGIAADEADKVFNRFYQAADKSGGGHHGIEGTGIGLYIVGRIVTECGGEIVARNNQSAGVSMRVFLPTPESNATTAPADAAAQEEADAGETPAAGRTTILVVEDSKDMRAYIRSILQDTYRVVEADNGVSGLTALAENDIDFIIADLMMPMMDGLEFARRVKADFTYSHTPILILTARTAGAYQTESYKIGVESYLHKPFDEEMLRARIAGILDGRQKGQGRFLVSLDTSDLNIERESEDEKFVNRVTNFVKDNYRNPDLSIDDIVNEVGCSKSMLHKKMQSVMGQAPGNFIRTYRLNVARELLANKAGGLNVSQVAYEVGFNDPKYFSRCFAKAFGYPPSAIG